MNQSELRGLDLQTGLTDLPKGRTHFFGIGINTYQHVKPLRNAVKDLDDIVAVLLERYDFAEERLTLLKNENATRKQILQTLYNFTKPGVLEPDDSLLIYYAGHGCLDYNEDGYWLSVESEEDSIGSYVSNSDVINQIKHIKCQHVLLISDSCFSGSLLTIGRDAPTDKLMADRLQARKSRWVIASGRGDETVADGADNSPFAHALLTELRHNQNSYIIADELAQKVRSITQANAQQMPQAGRIVGIGDEAGQFVFYLRLASVSVPKSTQQTNRQTLLQQLALGSQKYYQELRGINGPYHHLTIAESILGTIVPSNRATNATQLPIHTSVKGPNGEELSIGSSLQTLWQQDKPHSILLGDGGMGKTVSLLCFWETLLATPTFDNARPIPIFLSLQEYNTVSEAERDGFIVKRIAWHYLELKENREEAINSLWREFKAMPSSDVPSLVLLLDGFNEITVDASAKMHLLQELQELQQKGKAVQIMFTSRYEVNFSWAASFQTLELQLLDQQKIETYLQMQQVTYPNDPHLQLILQNPMMLTLYANASEIIERYKRNSQFDFKPMITSQGELLWNFLEAQIVKLEGIYTANRTVFHYYKFLIRHFLPYIGYEMERLGQFVLTETHLQEIVSDACQYFFRREFISTYHAYRSYLAAFMLQELDFAQEAERFESIIRVLCLELRLLKQGNRGYEFLHQNFRDYFAAVHILNDLQQSLQNKCLSALLKQRPLPVYIRRFVGQLAGEPYQTQLPSPPPTLLMQGLDSLRGIFDEAQTGYSVWNIVNCWKDTRSHLGGANFSNLNLLKTGFQDIFCYRRLGNRYQSAKFDNSLISENCILPQGHRASVTSVAFSPDGSRFVSASGDKTLKIWDAQTGQCLLTCEGHSHSITSAAFSPDNSHFISASQDRSVKLWDVKTGQCLLTCKGHTSSVRSVTFAPDGQRFISASDDCSIKIWDVQTGQDLFTCKGHSHPITSVAFSSDGSRFISASQDSTIKLWDAQTGQCLLTCICHSYLATKVAFSPDGTHFISASGDHSIKLWDALTGECLLTCEDHHYSFTSVAFSPNSFRFISGSGNGVLKLWDAQSGQCLITCEGHGHSVTSVTFSFDGSRFISASQDDSIKLWDAQTGLCLLTCEGHGSSVTGMAFSAGSSRFITAHSGGFRFISASRDRSLKVWDAQTGEYLLTCEGHNDAIAFSSDGSRFISVAQDTSLPQDHTIKLWDVQTGKCLLICEGHRQAITSAAFSPDGSRFISASRDRTIKLWDARTGECLLTYEGHKSSIMSVAFSPDGSHFISAPERKEGARFTSTLRGEEEEKDSSIKVWNSWTGECLITCKDDGPLVSKVAFSPDGSRFISASQKSSVSEDQDRLFGSLSYNFTTYGYIKIWDAQTGKCLLACKDHSSSVTSVAFSPDGSRFISASQDGSIKVWDAQTGQWLQTYKGDSITRLTISPDGSRFVSASKDNSIRLWDTQTGKCLRSIENIPGVLLAGCSFMNLHPQSQLSEEAKSKMRQYGALFNEADKKSWTEAIQRG